MGVRKGLFLLLLSNAAFAQVPSSPSGCGIGGVWARDNIPSLVTCLDSSTIKSDWENFALATTGPVIWPGNVAAEANSRAWSSVVANNLLGKSGGVVNYGVPDNFAHWHLTVNENYRGGTRGFVNSSFRVDTNVSSEVTDFPWGVLSVINTSAERSEPVAIYGQGNNDGKGPVFGGVFEVHARNGGTAVGVEIDAGCRNGIGNCVALDIVQPAGERLHSAVRVPCGVPALTSPSDLSSYITFPCEGGVKIISRGNVVASW